MGSTRYSTRGRLLAAVVALTNGAVCRNAVKLGKKQTPRGPDYRVQDIYWNQHYQLAETGASPGYVVGRFLHDLKSAPEGWRKTLSDPEERKDILLQGARFPTSSAILGAPGRRTYAALYAWLFGTNSTFLRNEVHHDFVMHTGVHDEIVVDYFLNRRAGRIAEQDESPFLLPFMLPDNRWDNKRQAPIMPLVVLLLHGGRAVPPRLVDALTNWKRAELLKRPELGDAAGAAAGHDGQVNTFVHLLVRFVLPLGGLKHDNGAQIRTVLEAVLSVSDRREQLMDAFLHWVDTEEHAHRYLPTVFAEIFSAPESAAALRKLETVLETTVEQAKTEIGKFFTSHVQTSLSQGKGTAANVTTFRENLRDLDDEAHGRVALRERKLRRVLQLAESQGVVVSIISEWDQELFAAASEVAEQCGGEDKNTQKLQRSAIWLKHLANTTRHSSKDNDKTLIKRVFQGQTNQRVCATLTRATAETATNVHTPEGDGLGIHLYSENYFGLLFDTFDEELVSNCSSAQSNTRILPKGDMLVAPMLWAGNSNSFTHEALRTAAEALGDHREEQSYEHTHAGYPYQFATLPQFRTSVSESLRNAYNELVILGSRGTNGASKPEGEMRVRESIAAVFVDRESLQHVLKKRRSAHDGTDDFRRLLEAPLIGICQLLYGVYGLDLPLLVYDQGQNRWWHLAGLFTSDLSGGEFHVAQNSGDKESEETRSEKATADLSREKDLRNLYHGGLTFSVSSPSSQSPSKLQMEVQDVFRSTRKKYEWKNSGPRKRALLDGDGDKVTAILSRGLNLEEESR